MNKSNFKTKLYIIVSCCVFFILVPIKCFCQTSETLEQARLTRKAFITEVKKYVGCPYVLGATGPEKFDCSGLVYYTAQKSIQKQLPRTVSALYKYVKLVNDSEKEAGDLLFFKTKSDSTISHVGVYIGNNQFISALSDGPNTGVIVSSLKEAYWKPKYCGVGKFLPTAKKSLADEEKAAFEADSSLVSETNSSSKFIDRLFLDGIFTADWSLFTVNAFIPNFRGLTLGSNIFYQGKVISPGFGFQTKWNYGTQTFQIPLIFSLMIGKYFRIYAGPVFTVNSPRQPFSDEEIKASIFPGIIGLQIHTPTFGKGKFKFNFYQDFSYTIYNNLDGAALSPLKSSASGFVLNSGFRVTFPFKVFFKNK